MLLAGRQRRRRPLGSNQPNNSGGLCQLLSPPVLFLLLLSPAWTAEGRRRDARPSSLPAADRCLHAKCPVLFPDCPPDSVPVLSAAPAHSEADQCCPPALVQCRCDPQKCLAPICPEGTERVLLGHARGQPGECCDQFECRQSEPDCQRVHCPDPSSASSTLDLYSPDGVSCPEDSYRPAPYVPSGQCCPLLPHCTCRLGICQPAHPCGPGQRLVVEQKGTGEPGKCCDRHKCVPEGADAGGEKTGGGCRHGGETFAVGQRWLAAPCQQCKCSGGGVALCRRMECPALAPGCRWVGVSPSECCPVCLGCRDEQGQTYRPGQHWERDGCTNCTCGEDFRWQCQKFICQTQCENPRPVPGECCPVCDEPTVVQWPPACPSVEHCQLRCEFGLLQSDLTGCFDCQCANGSASGLSPDARGQCEPLTSANCPRQCAHGYLRDQRGCPLCRCAHCPPMDRCGKSCVHGWESNWLGCAICKCRPGTTLPGDGGRAGQGATEGREEEGGTTLSVEQQTEVPFAVFSPSLSSPSSLRCVSNASERDIGEWWVESGCRQCFCQQGKEFCSLVSCPPRPSDCPSGLWLRSPGQCCPGCALASDGQDVLHSANATSSWATNGSAPIIIGSPSLVPQLVCHSPGTGQLFVDGETWHLDGQECLACTCRMGHVLCVWNDGKKCPPAPCGQPVMDPAVHKCCPSCPPASSKMSDSTPSPAQPCRDNATGALLHGALAEWRGDECQSCHCSREGQVQCFNEECPPLANCIASGGRLLSLKGRCCPLCSDELAKSPPALCLYNGAVFTPGEQFQDGPCRNCSCLHGGLLKCLEIHCPSCRERTTSAAEEEEQDEKAQQDQCCARCREEEEGGSSLLYSFERGTEQTVIIQSSSRQQQDNGEEAEERAGWAGTIVLAFGIVIPMLAFLIFVIGAAFMVSKCRSKNIKWEVGNSSNRKGSNSRSPIKWHVTYPDKNAEKRPSCPQERGADANIALLRLESQAVDNHPS